MKLDPGNDLRLEAEEAVAKMRETVLAGSC